MTVTDPMTLKDHFRAPSTPIACPLLHCFRPLSYKTRTKKNIARSQILAMPFELSFSWKAPENYPPILCQPSPTAFQPPNAMGPEPPPAPTASRWRRRAERAEEAAAEVRKLGEEAKLGQEAGRNTATWMELREWMVRR